MSDKFSLYQTDGLWGIIENASDEEQTSIKSYFGSDLIIKRLNEQADQIDQLKQQLDEKDIRIEELEGQFAYECECNKQLVELQKQLEKKQKTIDEINKEFVQAVHDWKTLCAEKDKEIESLKKADNIWLDSYQNELDTLRQNQTQLAIQELEKVKELVKDKSAWQSPFGLLKIQESDVEQIIDQQIKELKGEKQ